jgi:hypothetical protein
MPRQRLGAIGDWFNHSSRSVNTNQCDQGPMPGLLSGAVTWNQFQRLSNRHLALAGQLFMHGYQEVESRKK